MYYECLNEDMRRTVHNAVAADPNLMLNQLAERIGIPEGFIATALDADMCRVFPPDAFETIWDAMTRWESVTFIAITPGAIVEVKCCLPEGKFGHGFFNIGQNGHPSAAI